MASRSGCGHMWRRSYVLRRSFGLMGRPERPSRAEAATRPDGTPRPPQARLTRRTRNFGSGRAGASPAIGVFQPDDVLAPAWWRSGSLGEHDVADRGHPMYSPSREVNRVSRTEPAHCQLAAEGAVLNIGVAGDQADRLFLVLVILQAQRLPCGHVEDLAHVLALDCGKDLLMPPGLVLFLCAVDRGLRIRVHGARLAKEREPVRGRSATRSSSCHR